jgi:hypothetical protein
VQLWYFSQDAKNQTVGLIRQAGFNWMKVQVQWSAVETGQGQYDWSQLDQIVSAGNSGNLKVLLSVVDAPAFYRTPSSGLTPGDPNTFKTFMQALGARYAGKVQTYEIWNEETCRGKWARATSTRRITCH